jgi:hypothetical protein
MGAASRLRGEGEWDDPETKELQFLLGVTALALLTKEFYTQSLDPDQRASLLACESTLRVLAFEQLQGIEKNRGRRRLAKILLSQAFDAHDDFYNSESALASAVPAPSLSPSEAFATVASWGAAKSVALIGAASSAACILGREDPAEVALAATSLFSGIQVLDDALDLSEDLLEQELNAFISLGRHFVARECGDLIVGLVDAKQQEIPLQRVLDRLCRGFRSQLETVLQGYETELNDAIESARLNPGLAEFLHTYSSEVWRVIRLVRASSTFDAALRLSVSNLLCGSIISAFGERPDTPAQLLSRAWELSTPANHRFGQPAVVAENGTELRVCG